jgi:hypothetical protein
MENKCLLPSSQDGSLVPMLSQMNPVHALLRYFFKIRFKIIPIYILVFQSLSSLEVLRSKLYIYIYYISHISHAC